MSKKIEKSQRENHSEKKNEIGKKGKNVSCLARVGEVRRAMFSQKNHLCTCVQGMMFGL